MSRQFDEHFENCVDIDGILYELVEPTNFSGFTEALMVVDTIERKISTLQHDEDDSYYSERLETQEEYIRDYIDAIGKFDNSILADNINYLIKTNNMTMGELEKYLGISPGYISRTIGPDSRKKLSIDVAWKISKLFNKDLRTMLEISLRSSHNNTDLLLKFIEKLYQDTVDNVYQWKNDGGVGSAIESMYFYANLFELDDNDRLAYIPSHLNNEYYWEITGDVYSILNFKKGMDLAIIPYEASLTNDKKYTDYDFVLLKKHNDEVTYELVFSTSSDAYRKLKKSVDELYDIIKESQYDSSITNDMKKMVKEYIGGMD